MAHIDTDRLQHVLIRGLAKGTHSNPDEGMCAMEAVAYVAGEPFSDHPKCASPVISAFLRAWNDALPDKDRNRLLRPLIPNLVGSRGTQEVEVRRSYLALDWLVRVHTPAWLRLAQLDEHATTLEGLGELRDATSADVAISVVRAVENAARATTDNATKAAARNAARAAAGYAVRDAAAWAVAWDSAWNAAWAAAWAATGAVAGNAVWNAASIAAGATAENAVGNVVMAGAEAAAENAVGGALRSTVEGLQESALKLIERMLTVEVGQ